MIDYILFHQFKHHLHYVKAWVDEHKGVISDDAIKTIKTLGTSQLDMYTGILGVEEILQEVNIWLQQQGITSVGVYRQRVGNAYQPCHLSDGSSFTLRYINHSKPIHIHPARHVPHTMRIKANSLKSIICYLLAHHNSSSINITLLNAIRTQYLGLPPVAESLGIGELLRVLGLFASKQ